jgi:CPA2 family monovalent cation:H+ antiporter-2
MLALIARGEGARRQRLAGLEATLRELHEQAKPEVKLGLQPDQLMSKFPIFHDLDDRQRAELLAQFKPKSAAPGERIIRAGEIGTEMYFISSGAVEVSVGARPVQLGAGDFFGEMALLTGEPRTADVTAIDYCLFLTLGKDDFDRFIAKYPGLRRRLNEVAAQRAAMNRQRGQANG